MEYEARIKVSDKIFSNVLKKVRNELKFVKETYQEDYYFGSKELIEKLRREKRADSFLVRVRKDKNNVKVELKGDSGIWDKGYSVYYELKLNVCDSFENIVRFFKEMGLELVVVVKKKRIIFENKYFIVCFDDVEGLGKFIEVEAKRDEYRNKIKEFLKKFGIKGRISKGYVTQLVKGTEWEGYFRG